MNIITGYNDPIKIQLNYDNEGKPISKEMQPETHTVMNNKITLIQIPDEFYRVVIDGMVELHSYDDSPIQPNNFRVDYQNGLVTFHNSLEGQSITVDKYWGRGIVLTPSTRIYSKVNEAGEVVETIQDLIDTGENAIEGLQQLDAKLIETDQAIQNANTSADNANEKAQLAQEKAEFANTKAMLADEKAQLANNAADNANESINNLSHQGEYDFNTLYYARNIVDYLGSSYMAIKETQGNLPTDTNHWKLIGKKGDKGATLSPTGSYNNTRQYEIGDLVVYDGVVYNCIQNSIGNLPTNTDYWEVFLAGGMFEHNNDWHTEEYVTKDYVDNLETMVEHGNEWHSEEYETVSGATIKANQAEQNAKNYTDQQITLVTETGIPKLNVYEYKFNNVAIGTTNIEIPLETFDKNTDIVKLYINTVPRDSDYFTILDAIRDSNGNLLENGKIILNQSLQVASKVTIEVWKNIPIGDEGSVSGQVIAPDSIPQDRIIGLESNLISKANQNDLEQHELDNNAHGIDIVKNDLAAHKAEMVQQRPHGIGSIAEQEYEEGIWTPALRFGGDATGITYSRQEGRYRRIGKTVHIEFDLTIDNKGTAVGDALITGLPFVSNSSYPQRTTAIGVFQNITFPTSAVALGTNININSNVMSLLFSRSGSITLTANDTHFGNIVVIRSQLTYQI